MEFIRDDKGKIIRTLMFSVGGSGQVVRHEFPWNGEEEWGRMKLLKMEQRGFTFENPVLGKVEGSLPKEPLIMSGVAVSVEDIRVEDIRVEEEFAGLLPGFYRCSRCSANHRLGSAIGRRHRKHEQ